MSSASQAPLLPEQFGRYTNVRPLGQGGMGAVYRAHDPQLRRDVVFKVCLLADNPEAKERFQREARSAASLAPHQNLCPVYEFDVLDGIAYLTMGFIEGPTLQMWAAQRGGLSQREAALMVAKLALAMQVAHDGGVVHRDLKPANVVINKRGEPVILDFGLARQLDDPGTRLTQLGAIYGTPAYMAPEQAGGDPTTVGPSADVYALGVILYELLTGVIPFTGAPLTLLFNTINTPPKPPRQRNPAVDPALEAICLKALAKKPEERHGSMNDLAETLTEAGRAAPSRAGLPTPHSQQNPEATAATHTDFPRPPTLPSTLPTPSQGRQTSLALSLLLLLLGLLGVAGWYGYSAWQERKNAQDGDASTADKHDSADSRGKDRRPMPQDKPKDHPKADAPKNPPKVDPPRVDRPKDPPKKDPPKVDPLKKNEVNSLGMKFVHLPKGTFYMGWDGEKKGKKTEIKDDFEIATTTVTQEQWAALMEGEDKNPSMFSRTGKNSDDVKNVSDADLKRFPVENVSWDMVQKYIEKLNEKERNSGYLYRLPTQAEWEYSCREGATSEEGCSHHFYFAKPTDDLSAKEANFDGDFPFGDAPKVKSLKRPTMVDDPAYPTNRLGLHHMHGNVCQWCSDLYEEGALYRVFRGGGWSSIGSRCQAASRSRDVPTYQYSYLGCRLVRVSVR